MNIVHLSGHVSDVSVKEFHWGLAVQLRFEQDGLKTYIDVSSVKKGDSSLDRIRALKGKHVLIEGKLKSRTSKPSEKYPNPKTWFSVATTPGNAKAVPKVLAGWAGNSCAFAGKVKETKEAGGRWYVKIGISYYNPNKKEFGEWEVRVRCAEGVVPPKEGMAVVVGTVYVNDGVCVEATQVLAS